MKARIAMISEHASPLGALGGVDGGGQNVYVGQLAIHLARSGHEVDVFTRRDNPGLPDVLQWRDGVRIVHVPAGPPAFVRKEELLPFMAEFAAYMRDAWAALGPYDLIHANFWTSALVAAELKSWRDVPFVVTFHALGRVRRLHQAEADGFPDERFRIEDRIVAEADRIIAECPQDREDLIELYDADPSRITVVPCGFDASELSPQSRVESRRRLCLPQEEPVILQLGRLVPRKGIDNVVRALGTLRRRHELDARLLVVGGETEDPDPAETPMIGELASLAASQNVSDLVTFTGARKRDELKHYYGAADIFVTTPWYEPFGMTPLEAMACGRPVIGSDVGGIKYTVQQGKTGVLVPPRQPDALADAMAFLLRNRGLAEEMGRRGLERAKRDFTWPRVAAAIADVYERVLASRGAVAPSVAMPALQTIESRFNDNLAAIKLAKRTMAPDIVRAAAIIANCFQNDGKVLICGNGGSAADAQHFACEFVGRFQAPGRRALPAIALTADSAFLTAWSNDAGYEDVFARQVSAFGRAGDVLIGISTSGRSRNVLRAFETGRALGMDCLALTGGGGGDLRRHADVALVAPAADTQRIQEVHALLIHLICELVEEEVLAAGSGNEGICEDRTLEGECLAPLDVTAVACEQPVREIMGRPRERKQAVGA